MPVYVYDERNPHPGGGFGIRVQVTKRSRWFSFRTAEHPDTPERRAALLKEAHELDAAWRAERTRERLLARPEPSSPHITELRGIRAIFAIKRKRHRGRMRTYYSPAFAISISHNGEVLARIIRIAGNRNFEQAWRTSVEMVCAHKGVDDTEELIARCPDPSIFFAVWHHMRSEAGGKHAIPRSALPRETLARRFGDKVAYPTKHLIRLSKIIREELEARDQHDVESFKRGLERALRQALHSDCRTGEQHGQEPR